MIFHAHRRAMTCRPSGKCVVKCRVCGRASSGGRRSLLPSHPFTAADAAALESFVSRKSPGYEICNGQLFLIVFPRSSALGSIRGLLTSKKRHCCFRLWQSVSGHRGCIQHEQLRVRWWPEGLWQRLHHNTLHYIFDGTADKSEVTGIWTARMCEALLSSLSFHK